MDVKTNAFLGVWCVFAVFTIVLLSIGYNSYGDADDMFDGIIKDPILIGGYCALGVTLLFFALFCGYYFGGDKRDKINGTSN